MGLGTWLRIWGFASKNIWYDEACGLSFVQKYWTDMLDHRYITRPVYFFVLKIWTSIFGYTESGSRALSVIIGILSIYMLFKVGKLLFDKTTALFAAFVLAISPYHIMLSQQIANQLLLMLLALISVYYFLKSSFDWKGSDYKWYLFFSILLIFTRVSGLLIILIENIYLLIINKTNKRWWRGQIIIVFSFFMLLVLLYKWNIFSRIGDPVLSGHNLPHGIWEILQDFSFGKNFIQSGSVSKIQFIISNFGNNLIYIYMFLLCLGGITGLKVKKCFSFFTVKNNMLFVLLWFYFLMVVFHICSLFFSSRYVAHPSIIALPAFCLILGKGIVFFKRISMRSVIVCVIFILSLFALSNYYFSKTYNDWRKISEQVKSNEKDNDYVVFMPAAQIVPFWYYYKGGAKPGLSNIGVTGDYGRVQLSEGKWHTIFKDNGITFEGIDFVRGKNFLKQTEIIRFKGNYLWLIVSPCWFGEYNVSLVQDYLAGIYELDYKIHYDFENIVVYRYVRYKE